MSKNSNFEDAEIDLRELFAALWAHKILITLFTGLFIFLAAYNLITTVKKFTASAVFQIQQSNINPGFNISDELGALANLAGLSSADTNTGSKILLERVSGREFILEMKRQFSLDQDRYFNAYDPNYVDPAWKATIKKILGWEKTKLEKNAIVDNYVIGTFRNNIKLSETKGGAIKISVTHVDPQKASYYANNIMEKMRQLVEEESSASQTLRLNYLSETLADALQEMEEAQKNLKNYALKNSALAQENFISDSLKLDQIRMEKRKVKEIADLLSIIENFLKSGNLDGNSYEALRASHPLVDDIDFRRILGMSETISAWTWPDIQTIDAVSATLRDRIKRLNVDIANIEENAQIYATSAEDLAKYRRDAKIAEATYTVLIEQVKSQSLAAGFQPETFKVFEYATPPLTPSSPRRNLILAVATVLGIFTGCAMAILNSTLRNVYYTRSVLVSDAKADLAIKSKFIKRIAKKSISDIIPMISKKRITALFEADLKLANKKIIYVMNFGGYPTASNAARLLATQSAQSGKNVVICDTTGQTETEIKDRNEAQSSVSPIKSLTKNIDVVTGAADAAFFTSKTFKSTIKDLANSYDQVVICSSNRYSNLGLMALLNFSASLVVISRLRKTKKSDIKKITIRRPIDILFYE